METKKNNFQKGEIFRNGIPKKIEMSWHSQKKTFKLLNVKAQNRINVEN